MHEAWEVSREMEGKVLDSSFRESWPKVGEFVLVLDAVGPTLYSEKVSTYAGTIREGDYWKTTDWSWMTPSWVLSMEDDAASSCVARVVATRFCI